MAFREKIRANEAALDELPEGKKVAQKHLLEYQQSAMQKQHQQALNEMLQNHKKALEAQEERHQKAHTDMLQKNKADLDAQTKQYCEEIASRKKKITGILELLKELGVDEKEGN